MSFSSALKQAGAICLLVLQAACSVCEIRPQQASKYDALLSERAAQRRNEKISPTPAPLQLERVELALSDGTTHTALLSFPQRLRGKVPAVIVLGGFETGEKALDLLKTDSNVIFATTDYPYKAPNQRGFLAGLREVSAIRRAVRRTDLAVDALIEKLRQDPRVDTRKMTFVGASFGAPFTITAAVRNPELDAVILIHAFGRIDLAVSRQIENAMGTWSKPLAWVLGKVAWGRLAYIAPEKAVLGLHPKQRVFYIYSDADEQLPCGSIVALQDALAQSPAQVTMAKSQGGHLGPGKTEMIDELLAVSLEWLKDRDLL